MSWSYANWGEAVGAHQLPSVEVEQPHGPGRRQHDLQVPLRPRAGQVPLRPGVMQIGVKLSVLTNFRRL